MGKGWKCVAINASVKVIHFTFCHVKWKRRETQVRQRKEGTQEKRFSWTCVWRHAAVSVSSGLWRIRRYDTHPPHPAVTGMFGPTEPPPQSFVAPVPPPAKDPYEAHLPLSLPLRATEMSGSLKRLPTEAGVQKNVTFLVDFHLSPHCELSWQTRDPMWQMLWSPFKSFFLLFFFFLTFVEG